jgi:hypothetical protein
MTNCFNCSNYEFSKKITTGSGKKAKTKEVIGYCNIYKKSITELSSLITNDCKYYLEKKEKYDTKKTVKKDT